MTSFMSVTGSTTAGRLVVGLWEVAPPGTCSLTIVSVHSSGSAYRCLYSSRVCTLMNCCNKRAASFNWLLFVSAPTCHLHASQLCYLLCVRIHGKTGNTKFAGPLSRSLQRYLRQINDYTRRQAPLQASLGRCFRRESPLACRSRVDVCAAACTPVAIIHDAGWQHATRPDQTASEEQPAKSAI
jgi:hypothetical protein